MCLTKHFFFFETNGIRWQNDKNEIKIKKNFTNEISCTHFNSVSCFNSDDKDQATDDMVKIINEFVFLVDDTENNVEKEITKRDFQN